MTVRLAEIRADICNRIGLSLGVFWDQFGVAIRKPLAA